MLALEFGCVPVVIGGVFKSKAIIKALESTVTKLLSLTNPEEKAEI